MKPWNVFRLGSIVVLLLGVLPFGKLARAQDPSALAGLGGAAAPAAAAPAAAAGPNLFTMLLPPPELCERCRTKLCKCEAVKMLRGMMAPMGAMTGGLIGPGCCCPLIKKEDLLKPADSSEGAAARIMADLADAGARREAVRFLGTVDCRYWPEAEDALILALRGDKIECVRFEAAIALQRGCCCTKKTVKALTLVVEQSDKDGFPSERAHRVIDAAAVALSMCQLEEKAPEKGPAVDQKKIARVDPKDFYRNLDKASEEQVRDAARKALAQRGAPTASQVLAVPSRAQSQGVLGIIGQAIVVAQETPAPPMTTAQPPVAQVAAPQMPVMQTSVSQPMNQVNVAQPVIQPREQPVAVVSAPVAQPTQHRGLLYKLFPALNNDSAPSTATSVVSEPVPADTRPAGWVSGTTTTATPVATPEPQPGFSTANPTGYAAPRSSPYSPVVTPQTRNDNGVLGFTTMDNRR
jgi:hypothetical protein